MQIITLLLFVVGLLYLDFKLKVLIKDEYFRYVRGLKL